MALSFDDIGTIEAIPSGMLAISSCGTVRWDGLPLIEWLGGRQIAGLVEGLEELEDEATAIVVC
jgi:hypothetical protein